MAEPPLLAGGEKGSEGWGYAPGAVSTFTVCMPPLVNAGATLPTPSTMLVPPFRLILSVPVPLIPVMFTLTLEPEAAETLAMLPEADPVPTSVKSSVEMLATDSLKFTVKAMLVSPLLGEPLTTMLLTAGAMLSTVALVVSAAVVALPALSVAVKETLRLVAAMAPATMV